MMARTITMSTKGQIIIPEEVRDTLDWNTGAELLLAVSKHSVVLQAKVPETNKVQAKALKGFLQHKGEPVPTEVLCKPVEYTNDRL